MEVVLHEIICTWVIDKLPIAICDYWTHLSH